MYFINSYNSINISENSIKNKATLFFITNLYNEMEIIFTESLILKLIKQEI